MALPLAQQLRATANSATEVRLQWQIPPLKLGAQIIKYSFRVLRRREGARGWYLCHKDSDVFTSYTVSNLRPFTSYEFSIQSWSPRDDTVGDMTAPVRVTTHQGLPEAPRKFGVADVQTDAITVKWKAPKRLRGVLKGFRMFYDDPMSNEFVQSDLTAETQTFTAKHLFPSAKYRFQVYAMTDAGEGPPTDILTVCTRAPTTARFGSQAAVDDWTVAQSGLSSSEGEDSEDPLSEDEGELAQKLKAQQKKGSSKGFSLVYPKARGTTQGTSGLSTAPSAIQSSAKQPLRRTNPHAPRRQLQGDDWMQFSAQLKKQRQQSAPALIQDLGYTGPASQTKPRVVPQSQQRSSSSHGLSTSPALSKTEEQQQERAIDSRTSPPTSAPPPRRSVHPQAAMFDQMAKQPQARPSSRQLDLGVYLLSQGTGSQKEFDSTPPRPKPTIVELSDTASTPSIVSTPNVQPASLAPEQKEPIQSQAQPFSAAALPSSTPTTSKPGVSRRFSLSTIPKAKPTEPEAPKPKPTPQRPSRKQFDEDEEDPLLDEQLLGIIADGKATIRGKKNAVRKVLTQLHKTKKATATDELSQLFQRESEQNMIVMYITTTQAIRETYQACEDLKALFYGLRLKVHLKNIAMDASAKRELEKRIPNATVPQVFVKGVHLGGYKVVHEMNEAGVLKERLKGFAERALTDCPTCGGHGYVLCTWCQGSKRSLEHGFAHSTKDASLKCTLCNENALQRCPDC
eukprot:m.57776 g.57776  ORF g.57776 m.57776 type:complete len:737 (-) comp11629_c0_seq2:233-2443(-)